MIGAMANATRWERVTDRAIPQPGWFYENRPTKQWRCRVWWDSEDGVWSWEARRFQRRGHLHIAGWCPARADAKRVALAAVAAIAGWIPNALTRSPRS